MLVTDISEGKKCKKFALAVGHTSTKAFKDLHPRLVKHQRKNVHTSESSSINYFSRNIDIIILCRWDEHADTHYLI